MQNQKGSVVIGVLVILALAYAFMMFLSFRGWGYAGYTGGRAYAPSSLYFGGPQYYGSSSVRSGSAYGPSHVGGGPGAGK